MKILVTGSDGYVGSAVAALLDRQEHEVVRMDVKSGYDVVVAELPEVDAVVHLAAIVGEAACQANESMAERVNFDGALRIAAHYESEERPMIYVSTCSVYGDAGRLCREGDPVSPLGVYARTKLEAEASILAHDGAVLRLGTIFGIGLSRSVRYDLFVNEIARCAARGEPFSVYGGEAVRPWLHVADAAAIISLLIGHWNARVDPCQTYNVVAENMSKAGVVAEAMLLNPDLAVQYDGSADARDYGADASRIMMRLPIAPTLMNVRSGLREVFDANR